MSEIVGTSTSGDAVSGTSESGPGVRGTSTSGPGVVAAGTPAGSFTGDIDVTGDLNAKGIVNATHVSASGNISAVGNVNAHTVNTTDISAGGSITAAGYVSADAVNTNNVVCQGDINTNTTVNTTNLVAFGNISANGNVNAGATVNTTHVSAKGNISALGNVNGKSVNATDTVSTTHVSAKGNISALGNVNARYVNVEIDIALLNADCAEEFDVKSGADPLDLAPGAVVILDVEGSVTVSAAPYDTRVAGVVSGGGDYRPAIVLDRHKDGRDRVPIAMMGKVCCNVDATYAPIDVGDLLTTSATPGHAMKAIDPGRTHGSIIGKAMRPLADGHGMIPILVALQ